MRIPLVLLVASLLAAGASWMLPGLRGTVLPVALLSALAAALLLALAARRRRPETAARRIVVDGSNVLFWNGGTPALATVQAVVRSLSDRGFAPGVIFDANVGYRIADRYLDDADLARRLRLPADRVLVVPRATPADAVILDAARELRAPVVTNDRYRDWADRYPEVAQPGFLVRGGWREGRVRLDLPG
ncbi:MAG: NYN domain-containing protein [Gemmobacter sp.]